MGTTPETPAWLVPGAEIVVYQSGSKGYPDQTIDVYTHKTTVHSIDAVDKSEFLVEGRAERFKTATLTATIELIEGRSVSYTAVPVNSPEGQYRLALLDRAMAVAHAEQEVEKWIGTVSSRNDDELIRRAADAFNKLTAKPKPKRSDFVPEPEEADQMGWRVRGTLPVLLGRLRWRRGRRAHISPEEHERSNR
ncbi:hypothetical protein [Saccharopolyspora shandongensis]|uniref:hypothetical protein n=1 Tax=Saccharopolyspora shandongensis TaxID=418495 RepID=UPI00340056D6